MTKMTFKRVKGDNKNKNKMHLNKLVFKCSFLVALICLISVSFFDIKSYATNNSGNHSFDHFFMVGQPDKPNRCVGLIPMFYGPSNYTISSNADYVDFPNVDFYYFDGSVNQFLIRHQYMPSVENVYIVYQLSSNQTTYNIARQSTQTAQTASRTDSNRIYTFYKVMDTYTRG